MPSVYSEATAERVVQFQSVLYKAIGLELPAFQKALTRQIYGNLNANSLRTCRRALLSVPRKSAKSTYVASLALYHVCADNERNPKIYIAATTLEQAGIIFEIIGQFVDAVPFLRSKVIIKDSPNRKEAIYYRQGKKHGIIKALTKGGSKDGFNPSLVLADELGQWREAARPLWDSITSGSVARSQPLLIMTSTSADDNSGMFYEQYLHAKRILAGEIVDDEFQSFILEVDPDRWSDQAEWIRVNPLVAEGFIPVENLLSQYKQALVDPHEMHKFKRKTLNMWVGSTFGYLDMTRWREQTETIQDSHLIGLPCVAALDLSRRDDFTSLVLTFRELMPDGRNKYYTKPFFWLPEEGLLERSRTDGKPYKDWVKQGLLYLSPGPTIDYHLIIDKIKELALTYSISMIAYDDWNAEYAVQDLVSAGFNVTEFRQGFKSMNAPMKELQSLVLNRLLVHGNNPILTWQASNLTATEDEVANVKPSKRDRKSKIDGIVAAIMGLGTLMRNENMKPTRSALSWFNDIEEGVLDDVAT